MNRRNFLNIAALGAAAGVARSASIASATPNAKIEAVAFDGFAIFDPRPIRAVAEAQFPGKGAELTTLWRSRQFEYTWLRTLTGSYVSFWQVTQEALAFACESLQLALTAQARDRLMQAFLELNPWPDAVPALELLRSRNLRLAFLTNFTPDMLEANIRRAGLGEYFEARLSTDRVGAFKPDPRAYQMGVDHFALPRSAIAFVAFGGWDAAGAARFGFPVYWTNRLAQPAEVLGAAAGRVAPGLEALAAFVAAP
jgi:2-haloacid dehalogenase